VTPPDETVAGFDVKGPDETVVAHLNYMEMCRTITRGAGGRLLEVDGVLLWAGAHPSPAIVNGVIRTREGNSPPKEVLDVATKWFADIGHGYTLNARVGGDDDLESFARQRGFSMMLELPIMRHDGPPPEVTVPEGYALSRVEDAQDLGDLVEAVAGPFELPDEVASVFARPEAVLSPFTAAVIVRDADGRPVAGAWTGVSHSVAGIGFVGTAERARGRGLGTAATAAAMRLGYAMGARAAVLQASPMGRSVYARMGFREIGAYRLLVDSASSAMLQGTH